MDMKRLGILAVAGLFAIVGCSKKIEKQEKAAKTSESAAGAASAAGKVSASFAKSYAPRTLAALRAGAPSRTHVADSLIPGWNSSTKTMTQSGSAEGFSYTMTLQFKDSAGNLVDILHVESTGVVKTFVFSFDASKSDGSFQKFSGSAADQDTQVVFNGEGSMKDVAEKADGTMKMESMLADPTGVISGKMTFSGTADGDTFAGSITWANRIGDGTMTVGDETIKLHINADGTGTWEDSKGGKHNFA